MNSRHVIVLCCNFAIALTMAVFVIFANAQSELSAEEAWQLIQDSNRSTDFYQFVQNYPDSRYVEPARLRMAELLGLGVLTVRSNVSGDTVTIDGVEKGSTRLDLILDPGRYTVRVVKAGHTSWEEQVAVKPGETVIKWATLKPLSEARVAAPSEPPRGDSTSEAEREKVEIEFWNSIRNESDPSYYELYLARYPNGLFADIARLKTSGAKQPTDAQEPTPAATTESVSSSGEEIRALQEALLALDLYRGPADARQTPALNKAIQRFQKTLGYAPTGTLSGDQKLRLQELAQYESRRKKYFDQCENRRTWSMDDTVCLDRWGRKDRFGGAHPEYWANKFGAE